MLHLENKEQHGIAIPHSAMGGGGEALEPLRSRPLKFMTLLLRPMLAFLATGEKFSSLSVYQRQQDGNKNRICGFEAWGAERKIVQNDVFRGKHHDNKILKVQVYQYKATFQESSKDHRGFET